LISFGWVLKEEKDAVCLTPSDVSLLAERPSTKCGFPGHHEEVSQQRARTEAAWVFHLLFAAGLTYFFCAAGGLLSGAVPSGPGKG